MGAHKYSTDLCEDGVCVFVMPWIQLVVPGIISATDEWIIKLHCIRVL